MECSGGIVLANRLGRLLKNILCCEDGKDELINIDAFGSLVSEGLWCAKYEAMALVGYLLKSVFAIIDPCDGLVINPKVHDTIS